MEILSPSPNTNDDSGKTNSCVHFNQKFYCGTENTREKVSIHANAIRDFIASQLFRKKKNVKKLRHDRTTLKIEALHWLTHIQITYTMVTNLFHLYHFHGSLRLGQPVIIVSEYMQYAYCIPTHKNIKRKQLLLNLNWEIPRMRTTNDKVLNWHYERHACSLNVNASFVGKFETNYYRCI